MCYLDQAAAVKTQSYCKEDAVAFLEKYRDELSAGEYRTIFRSLSSLAMEGVYLNEKDILLSIAQLRNEISLADIIAAAKSA